MLGTEGRLGMGPGGSCQHKAPGLGKGFSLKGGAKMPLSLAGVQQWRGGGAERQMLLGSPLSSPGWRWATETARPPVLRLRARLPRKSLQPRLMSQFQLKKQTLSGTVTGGGRTRAHGTRPQCADEGEPR